MNLVESRRARIEYTQKYTDCVLGPFRIDVFEDDEGVGVRLLYSQRPSKKDLDRIWSGLDKVIKKERYGGYIGFKDICPVGLADRVIVGQSTSGIYELFLHFCEP